MGLSWQQGPLSPTAIGRFLVAEPLPKRLLYAEPLRRRMRVRFGGTWIADSEDVLLLFEPGRYPVAYFPETDVFADTLQRTEHTTRHQDLGLTSWYTVRAGEQGCAATTTLVTHVRRPGRIVRHILKSAASVPSCHSSRTPSPYRSMARSSASSQVRP